MPLPDFSFDLTLLDPFVPAPKYTRPQADHSLSRPNLLLCQRLCTSRLASQFRSSLYRLTGKLDPYGPPRMSHSRPSGCFRSQESGFPSDSRVEQSSTALKNPPHSPLLSPLLTHTLLPLLILPHRSLDLRLLTHSHGSRDLGPYPRPPIIIGSELAV